MSRLKTIRRRLLLCAGSLLVLSGLGLIVAHTSLVRRFALVQMQIRLGNAVGVTIHAQDLDYNLLTSWFELKGVSVRGAGLTDLPAPLEARRIQLVIPVWRLITGSFETARIQIDGLSVRWIAARDGRANWPAIGGTGGGGGSKLALPAILVTGGTVDFQDDRSGLVAHLPLHRLSARWDPGARRYGIACESSPGWLRWNGTQAPLDQLQIQAAIADGNFVIDSLHLVSGASVADVRASLSGSTSRIEAAAYLNLDLREFSKARGRVQARLSATGLLDSLQVNGIVQADTLVVDGTALRGPSLEAQFDSATGEIAIRNLSAGIFGAQLIGNGRLRPNGRSEVTASLNGLKIDQAASILGPEAAVRVAAAFPGFDWQRASVSGTARSQRANLSFAATVRPGAIRATFDSSLADSATVHGEVGLALARRELSGALTGDIASLAKIGSHFDLPALDGTARWSATLGGTTAHPAASLQLSADGLAIGGWTGAALQADASYAAGHIAIGHARLTWAGQQLDAEGEIGGVSEDAPLALEGTIQGTSLAPLFAHLDVAPVAEAAVSGRFQISGTAAHPVAEAKLKTGELTVYGERFSRAELSARWQGGELTVNNLAVDQARGSGVPGRFQATGCLDPVSGRFVVDAAGQNLYQAFAGTLRFDLHGEGMLADPVFSAQLDASDVKAGEAPLGEVHAQIEANGRHATASITAPALHANAASTVTMAGAWPFELTLDSRNTRLDPASFDAVVRAGGTLAPLNVEHATVAVDNLRLNVAGREIAGDGTIDLSYGAGRIHVGRLALKSGDFAVRIAGEMPLEDGGTPGSLSLKGAVDLHTSLTEGTADVDAAITGSARNWRPAGTVAIHGGTLNWRPLPVDNIAGKIQLDGGVIRTNQISGTAGKATVQIAGSVPWNLIAPALSAPAADPAQPAKISAQIDNLEFSGGSGEQLATLTASAKLEAEASTLALSAIRGAVEFSQLEAYSSKGQLRQNGATRIAIADGMASLDHFDFGGADVSLKAAGNLGLTGAFPLRLDAAGKTDLGLLSALAAPLETAGTVQLELHARGTLSDPKTTGFVELEHASAVLPDPPIQVADIKLHADLNGDHVTVKEFTGTLNGGAFSGGGELKLGAAGLRDVDLFLKGRDTFTAYPFAIRTVSSLDVTFASKGDRLVLGGQIEVQEGYYESALDAFSRSNQSLNLGSEDPLKADSNPVALDLHVTTRRPVEMDNNLGRISATADLRLAGNVKNVGLLGEIQLEQDGKLYFGDRTYFVERGTVRFRDQSHVTPILDIRAYTRTGDYTIYLGLSGPPDQIATTFTSDPPLSRDDVIAVLLTGRTVADNRGVDLRALEATALATGAMNASLSSELHRTLGISRVSIQPAAIAAESNPGARITVTQDFTSSLRLLYSMNLSDSNDQIWVGEYDLSRHFTTRAVKQSDNTYRGEFRHDIRFGSASPPTGAPAARATNRKISQVTFNGGGLFPEEALAKVFKAKPGQQYKAIKVRKAADRLSGFLMKKGYLESRVRLDRDEGAETIGLGVRIELGPMVHLEYRGASLPRKQTSKLRSLWHAGVSDQQRPLAAKEAILGYYARKGYPRAQTEVRVAKDGDHKTVRFDLQPGARYRGIETVVQGVDPRRSKEILSLLDQQPMKTALYRNPIAVVEGVTRYYRQRGFLAAKVAPPMQKLDVARRTGQIVVAIEEGPLFHVGALQFSGNRALSVESLQTGVPLATGGVFEPARLDPTVAAVKQKYGKLGYREAEVEFNLSRDDERALIDVAFTVVENRQTSIAAITVEGNRHTSERFARRQVKLAEGEVANTELIRESVKNLSQTGAYSAADILLRPAAPAGASADKPIEVADLVVAVSEPKPFRLLYGGLYDSGNGPGFIADFQNHNLIGSGRVVGLRTRYDSETDEVRLYVTQPTWKSHKLSTTFATYFTRETQYLQTTPTQKLGVSIQQDVQLRSKWLLSYGYRYEKQRGFIPDPAAPPIPQTVVAVAPLTLTFSRDSRDSFLDASRGSFVSHGFELAPHVLGSDYPYARYYVQYFKYFSLTHPRPVPYGEKEQRPRLIFASGSRLGVQKGFNSTGAVLTDRFYAGGGTTVRGFHQDELGPKLANGKPAGGNTVLVLNEELRYPLVWIFDAVSFIDIGNVYPRVSDFRLGDLRAAYGFGLRIRNPFVVLRFDYGFKFNRRPGETIGAFFFSIGQAF